ncbi:hypothetical protein PsYK624_098260 [Phanerochaete sordida]|uniref:Uncharacterized protein n=1 Tax=Phanerochaete sordida TaxID=48140 RepID=A0A9P3GEY3_9APHY|nr:hypothetical protein PsYK624_098260 [Phanerochaete sordida]
MRDEGQVMLPRSQQTVSLELHNTQVCCDPARAARNKFAGTETASSDDQTAEAASHRPRRRLDLRSVLSSTNPDGD